eukprot:10193819-Ditylum_brightwellii.AAC.2
MLSTCIFPGYPGKKKHKTTSSRECIWNNKLCNVKNKDVSESLKQITINFLHASAHDVVEVLLEKLYNRGEILMLTDDVADLLKTECFCILSQVNENNGVLKKGVSNVSVCMPCSDGTGTMVSSKHVDTAQNDAVECIEFLDTIELNDNDNSIGVDIDAVGDSQ